VEARTQVVGIDEAHFYDDEIPNVVESLADTGKRVIVAGLDLDYLGQPFDHVTRILAQAEEITKSLAICVRCGNPASRTQRLVASEERIVVGGQRAYEARCRQCFEPRLAQAELPLEDRARKIGP
jgi:thymidine kinase